MRTYCERPFDLPHRSRSSSSSSNLRMHDLSGCIAMSECPLELCASPALNYDDESTGCLGGSVRSRSRPPHAVANVWRARDIKRALRHERHFTTAKATVRGRLASGYAPVAFRWKKAFRAKCSPWKQPASALHSQTCFRVRIFVMSREQELDSEFGFFQ